MKPWLERRLDLVQQIHSRESSGLAVNLKRALKTYGRETSSRDIRRLVEEGYAIISQKSSRHYSALASRLGKSSKSNRSVFLTSKGEGLLPVPMEVTLGPYAKRNAELAKMKLEAKS